MIIPHKERVYTETLLLRHYIFHVVILHTFPVSNRWKNNKKHFLFLTNKKTHQKTFPVSNQYKTNQVQFKILPWHIPNLWMTCSKTLSSLCYVHYLGITSW